MVIDLFCGNRSGQSCFIKLVINKNCNNSIMKLLTANQTAMISVAYTYITTRHPGHMGASNQSKDS